MRLQVFGSPNLKISYSTVESVYLVLNARRFNKPELILWLNREGMGGIKGVLKKYSHTGGF